MKNKPNLERFLNILLIVLALLALGIVAASTNQFKNTKAVYRGF